jgi:Capsule polysaccharide biosynthesis protein
MLLFRSATELEGAADSNVAGVWLGEGPAPERTGFLVLNPIPADPPLTEGWLWLRRWGDEPAGAGSLKEALEYGGVSLWWFANHWIMYGESLPAWDEIYRVLDRVVVALDGAHPSKLTVLSRHPIDELVAAAVAEQLGVPCHFQRSAVSRMRVRATIATGPRVLSGLRLAKLLMRGFLARRIGRGLAAIGPVDLLYNSSSTTLNVATGEERVLEPLLECARKRGLRVVGAHMDFQRRLGLDTLRGLGREMFAWESSVTISAVVRAGAAARRIRARLARPVPGTIRGVPARLLIGARAENLAATRVRDSILALESAREIIRRLRPRAVFVTDGYDMWGRSLVVACREAGTRVVEVQHGVIHATHAGYLHLPGEVDPGNSIASPFSPLADAICVSGPAVAQTLIESGRFPPSVIRVTGSLTLDPSRSCAATAQAIRERVGVPAGGVLASYFGVPDAFFPADRLHVEAFLRAAAEAQVHAVLRPHPGDSGNPARYRAAAASAPGSVAVLDDVSPWDLLAATDVLLTHNSTAGLDAMAFSRPVIHLNMSSAPDLYPYVSEGRAISASTAEQLLAALLKLSDPAERARQVERQKPYIDGLVAPVPSPANAILEVGLVNAI